jgi:RNA polymerase sigma-70 factor (ECF subfamily)
VGRRAVADVTEAEFTREAEGVRRELLAHCYRLSGSVQDAEDLVQETLLRGWRAYDRFRGEASVRGWLYRIATNAYLSDARRRHLPSDAAVPEDALWIEPIPDALVADPADRAVRRDELRLALVASLQRLPARQRAALLLREALDWSAAEIADALDVSVPAVKSLLQRARATLAATPEPPPEPGAERQRELLDVYIRAFETTDVALLERTLRDDALLEVTPGREAFAGKRACMAVIRDAVGAPGDWRMEPTRANGQAAAVVWFRAQPYGVAVLGLAEDGIARISALSGPALVDRFASP